MQPEVLDAMKFAEVPSSSVSLDSPSSKQHACAFSSLSNDD